MVSSDNQPGITSVSSIIVPSLKNSFDPKLGLNLTLLTGLDEGLSCNVELFCLNSCDVYVQILVILILPEIVFKWKLVKKKVEGREKGL